MMERMLPLHGMIPPVPTPFTAGGEPDLDALRALIGRLEPHVDGFLVLGSNGEAVYLSEEERSSVLEAAREVIPAGKPMIAGTGGEATRLVVERNEFAAGVGVDVVLVLAPHYYLGRMTDEILAAHFREVADSSPLPVMLYNIPASTSLALSPALIESLAGHPNIVGLKDSSGNLVALTEVMRRVPEGFMVLSGNAPTILPALSLGASGGILAVANVVPAVYRRIVTLYEQGELEEARALQLRFNPLALAVTTRFGVSGLKAAMRLQGIPAGCSRAPLRDVTLEQEAELRALLDELLD